MGHIDVLKNKPPANSSESFESFSKIQNAKKKEEELKNKNLSVDQNLKEQMGEEEFYNLLSGIEQLTLEIKLLVKSLENKEKGNGKKVEDLLHKISDNLKASVSELNNQPEKLLDILNKLKSGTDLNLN